MDPDRPSTQDGLESSNKKPERTRVVCNTGSSSGNATHAHAVTHEPCATKLQAASRDALRPGPARCSSGKPVIQRGSSSLIVRWTAM